jgi:tetraacyldisaccharide 4'-kinase
MSERSKFSSSEFKLKLQRYWYQEEPNKLMVLYPLSMLFLFLSTLRLHLFRLGIFQTRSVPVPVIVVGNITVGGTGKTPVVIALVEYLKSRGFKPGVVSRGYGGHASTYPMLVNNQTTSEESGDEPQLIFKSTGVPVVVDPKRIRAANLLAFDAHCDVIISDDGLQHRAMDRDMDIVVVDAKRGFGNKQLLPVGPLREPLKRLKDFDWALLNCGLEKCVADEPLKQDLKDFNEKVAHMYLELGAIQALPTTRFDSIPVKGDTIHGVAGIGNPQRFFETLESLGYKVIPHAFSDHHRFKKHELNFPDKYPVIMTEKDATKCEHFDLQHLWYLPVKAKLSDDLVNAVNKLMNI